MPALRPRRQHECVRSDRLADRAGIDQLAARLQTAAEERIGRAADAHVRGAGRGNESATFPNRQRQRLFAIHRLSGADGGAAHRHVRLRNRQVHDEIDVAIGEQRVDRQRPRNPVRTRKLVGTLCVDVGARYQVDERQRVQFFRIHLRDDAAADDADAARNGFTGLLRRGHRAHALPAASPWLVRYRWLFSIAANMSVAHLSSSTTCHFARLAFAMAGTSTAPSPTATIGAS